MKKVIILKKIQVTMKTFVPPFFNHLRLILNRKKRVVMRDMRKKLNIFILHASTANLLHIRIRNLDWCKCGHCKNETRKIDCLCCREIEMDTMVIISTKIPKCVGKISPPAFMGYYPTISHTC